ncbi:MAG TPA: hypothetical protein VEU62_17360, partial [Bryobacterales bacterium]|nr:hypothetical protein [Bryobacterales bacterium]
MRRLLLLFLIACCCAVPPASADDDVVLRAMSDEMARAVRDLRLENLPRPYYMDCTALESDTFSGVAVFGGLARSERFRSRSGYVNVRVGSYQLDNTNFVAGAFARSGYDAEPLPLEDDYLVLRRHFWLPADEAYKGAVEALARKQAALQHIRLSTQLNDFARQEPVESLEPRGRLSLDKKAWEQRLREFSALFRRYPLIQSSRVELEAAAGTTWFVNSEGTRVRDPDEIYLLQAFASTQAPDGMRLWDAVSIAARRAELLGGAAEIRAQIEAMA